MYRIRSIDLHPWALAHRVNLGRTIAVIVTTGLALVITIILAVAGAVRAGIAPAFGQSIVLDARHRLAIHNGPSPTCASIPNPHSTIASGQVRSGVSSPWIILHRMGFGRWCGSGCRSLDPQKSAEP